MAFKFLGIQLGKTVKAAEAPTNKDGSKKRASKVIKPQVRREISYQIEDIKTALNMAKNPDTPDRKKLLGIYDYILKDAHLKSQIRTAKFKVLSEPWLIYNGDSPDDAATKLVQKIWMRAIIEYIVEAELFGYSVVEANELAPNDDNIGEAVLIDRDYISIEKQYILIEGTINGSFIPYAEYMREMDLLEFGKRNDYGILLECAYNIIWKYYSRSDWSRGSEKFGMPILSIEADTNNDDELDAIETRAANFGSDGYIVTQKGDTVNIIERTGQRMHDIWLDNIKLCNDEVSKTINGGTATSDQKSFVGSSEVQERTLEDFTLSRLQNIVDEVNAKVLPYLVTKGFKLEGRKLDYPALIREREKKINGQQTATDPKETDPEKEESEKPKPALKPKPPFKKQRK